MSEQLLEVRDLRVVYESDEETVHAVNGISFWGWWERPVPARLQRR